MKFPFLTSSLRYALPSAMGLMLTPALAETDPEVLELTMSKSMVEVGVQSQNGPSAKANEYNGVTGKNVQAIANIDLRGGGAYDSDDATRWRLTGRDLGTRARSVDGQYGTQGTYKVKFGYDELRRNASDSYQTPYLGVGTTSLRLPSTWVPVAVPALGATTPNARGLSPAVTSSNTLISGVSTPPTGPQLAAAAAIQAADLPAFGKVDLFTQRTRYALGWQNQFSERWSFDASLSHERKEGLKAQGAVSRATGAYTSSILPVPVDQYDDKLRLGLSYTDHTAQMQFGYEGSSFKNNVQSVNWNLWGAPGTVGSMSSDPSNLFNKLYFSGSTQASPATRLTAAASYARSSQNERFVSDASALAVPAGSADALVLTQSLSLKAVNRTTKDLSLSAGYKYDLRDNRTAVNTYGFYDADSVATGASPFAYLYPSLTGLGANFNLMANVPYSKRVHEINLDSDYRFSAFNRVKVGVDANRTERFCRGTWIACANAASSDEGTLRADWLSNPSETVSTRLGLAASARRVDHYNEDAWLAMVPMANQSPSTATGALAGTTAYGTLVAQGLTGYGPVLGVNPPAAAGSALAFYFPTNNALNNALYADATRLNELIGMRRSYQADRNRGKLRSSIAWQTTPTWSLQAGLDGSVDSYTKSVYGLQKSSGWALNLDATYAPSEDTSLSVFTSFDEQRSRLAGNSYTANSTATAVNGATAVSGGCYATIAERNSNAKIDPCMNWASSQRDQTATLGLSLAKNKVMRSKFDLQSSAVYSQGRTLTSVTGGSYANNPFAGVVGDPTSAIAAYYIPATALPPVRIQNLEIRLGGTYHLSNQSALRVGLGYQRLRVTDWRYEGMQDGGVQQVLPTREVATTYGITTVGISFVSRFP